MKRFVCLFGYLLFVFNAFSAINQNVTDNIIIADNAISMPLGRFILYHSDNKYAAIRFTRSWIEKVDWFTKFMVGKDAENHFSEYDIYYQLDSNAINFKQTTYTHSTICQFASRYAISRYHQEINHEQIQLFWSGGPSKIYGVMNYVYFGPHSSDLGYKHELAPTPWTKIEEVNFNDPRLKWYKYNENRKEIIIPIDKLWENTSAKKKP